MARIAGVNLPTNKRVIIALTYIHGIGRKTAVDIADKLGIDHSRRVQDLSDAEVLQIRETLDADHTVEGDLRRNTAMNIKRLMDLACYRGLRHRKGLPVRGQRTHTNARAPARARQSRSPARRSKVERAPAARFLAFPAGERRSIRHRPFRIQVRISSWLVNRSAFVGANARISRRASPTSTRPSTTR